MSGGWLKSDYSECVGSNRGGFTLTEILIITVVISILATLIVLTGNGFLVRARDGARASDVKIISSQLERYYRSNPTSTGSSYPPTTTTTNELVKIVGDGEALAAPNGDENGLVVAMSNALQSPALNKYVYQPLTASGALCDTAPCTHYKLYYRSELTNDVRIIDSMRQQ